MSESCWVCPNCEAQVPDDRDVCQNCGYTETKQNEDPCENCTDKLSLYCLVCCPVHAFEDFDEEELEVQA
jgi:ribosomal protein L40E